ncbi:uncharacterized protein LOC133903218 [Phragmites australis]|uniref:uncharacterized protein LOC133903218 n=1 Tax=Phragmites australis TaxID=29695 RepID=UPI002D78F124|nr:uncharacterized protein LOC133903218 [Phragmites australis]
MGIQISELKIGVEPFHGITPNSSIMPLYRIELTVTFGTPDNFRTEKMTFDVTDFKTAYNVILGRPMLGKFIEVVHYSYQMLKIPGPKGAIIVKGDQRVAVKCDKQSLDIVEHFGQVAIIPKDANSKHQRHQDVVKAKNSRLVSLASTSDPGDAEGKINNGINDKKIGGCVKPVPLDPSEPSKMVKIRANLDPK